MQSLIGWVQTKNDQWHDALLHILWSINWFWFSCWLWCWCQCLSPTVLLSYPTLRWRQEGVTYDVLQQIFLVNGKLVLVCINQTLWLYPIQILKHFTVIKKTERNSWTDWIISSLNQPNNFVSLLISELFHKFVQVTFFTSHYQSSSNIPCIFYDNCTLVDKTTLAQVMACCFVAKPLPEQILSKGCDAIWLHLVKRVHWTHHQIFYSSICAESCVVWSFCHHHKEDIQCTCS